jgi:hypothetical protein
MQKVTSRAVKFILSALVLATAIVGYAWNKWSGACITDQVVTIDPFEIVRWSAGDIGVRQKMLGSLLAGKKLVGAKRVDILSLLGKPDSESNEQIGYVVATYSGDHGCGFYRHAILKIRLDHNAKVNHVSVVND